MIKLGKEHAIGISAFRGGSVVLVLEMLHF